MPSISGVLKLFNEARNKTVIIRIAIGKGSHCIYNRKNSDKSGLNNL